MSSQNVFTNPFAIPNKKEKNQQKQTQKESFKSFLNFNPTLNKSTGAKPKIIRTFNNNCNKRTFHAMNNENYTKSDDNFDEYANKKRKRQKYRNDGGLTDMQYESILKARELETQTDIEKYREERRRNYPSKENVAEKRKLIEVKSKRGQLLSTNERIMKYQDDTGNKKTPSVLRFLRTPKFEENIVRKVLHKEINQEYSAILQCFRYFIKTNYLTKSINDEQETNDNDRNEIECVETEIDCHRRKPTDILPKECAFNADEIEKDENLLEQDEAEEEDDVGLDILNDISIE